MPHNHNKSNDPFLVPKDERRKSERRQQSRHLSRMTVEECFALPIGLLGKKILSKPGDVNPYPRPIGSSFSEYPGKHGTLRLSLPNDSKKLIVSYQVALSYSNASVRFQIAYDGNNPIFHDQTIKLYEHFIAFGTRPYFLCPSCSEPKTNLYLRPDSSDFQCRRCNKLVYGSQLLSPNKNRTFMFAVRKLAKIMNVQEKLNRYLYKGVITKRALRLKKAIEKYQKLIQKSYSIDPWEIPAST